MTSGRSDDAAAGPFGLTVADASSPDRARLRREAAGLLARAVGPDLADDRFEPYDAPDDGSLLVLARRDRRAVAYVSATSSRGRLQLDVAADHHAVGNGTDLVDLVGSMTDLATTAFDRHSPDSVGPTVEFWGRPRQPWHDALAADLGLEPHRSLYQMRCPLPRPDREPARVDRTRGLDSAVDPERVLAVNNRAFAAHPDQSDQRLDDLLTAFSARAFEPESVRILDPDPADQRAIEHPMVGFCWTKIHPERPGREALGEIYVIAVDPAYHGEGHGSALTAAGLAWLAGQGLERGMLYVESDNDPAVATYHKLGFTVHATYTAWRRTLV